MLRKIKQQIKQAFHFSNRESNGLLAIIVLIFLLIITPKVYKVYYTHTHKPLDHNADIALLEKNLTLLQENSRKVTPIPINTATPKALQTIAGITQPLAIRILRYRDKLGGFVSFDQYKEVYHLPKPLQVRLSQCTTIPAQYKPKKLSLNQATFQTLVAHTLIFQLLSPKPLQRIEKRKASLPHCVPYKTYPDTIPIGEKNHALSFILT